jgi:hypothetical protein
MARTPEGSTLLMHSLLRAAPSIISCDHTYPWSHASGAAAHLLSIGRVSTSRNSLPDSTCQRSGGGGIKITDAHALCPQLA